MPGERALPTRLQRPASLALRVTLLVGLATTLTFLLFALATEHSIERHFAEQDLGELQTLVQPVQMMLQDAAAGAVEPRLADSAGHWTSLRSLCDHLPEAGAPPSGGRAGARSVLVLHVVDARGRVLCDNAPAGLVAAAAGDPPAPRLDGAALRVWTAGGHSYRGAVLRLAGSRVLVATAIDFHLHFLAGLRRALWLGTAAASALSVLVAWLAVQRAHAPIRRIGARMREVTSARLDVRLDAAKVPIELADLVASFNAMLERIGESFRRLSNFSADIAHELRTPVTNLATQTQVALSRARSSDDYREVLYSNLEEYERMGAMIGDMLFLAQADRHLVRPDLAEVDVAAEVRALFDYFEAWAEDRGVGLELRGQAPAVRCDRAMLRRAFSNLIANAVRHTAAGGSVVVRLSQVAGKVEIGVENPGEAIPAEHLPHLFERFYRVDPSRQRNGDGAGLGLAIVKSIAEAHGGSAGVESVPGRTRFWIRL